MNCLVQVGSEFGLISVKSFGVQIHGPQTYLKARDIQVCLLILYCSKLMQLPSLESFLSYTRVKGSDWCFGSNSSSAEHRTSVLTGAGQCSRGCRLGLQ